MKSRYPSHQMEDHTKEVSCNQSIVLMGQTPPREHVFLVRAACRAGMLMKGNVGVTTWCKETNDLLMRYTDLRHPPSYPFTNIRVHVKAPLNRNWYPRSGIVENFWIYDTPHAQYTRPYSTGHYLPIRACNIASPSSASTSFDPLCGVQSMSGASHPNLELTLDQRSMSGPTELQRVE